MTDKYVDTYLHLEDKASGAESKAEDYRKRAEYNRWEQCRIVHEAVDSGEYSRSSFARATGVSTTTIDRQYRIWNSYASVRSRPASYAEAWAMSIGSTQAAETDRKQLVNARAVLKNPDAARELLADPVVAAVLGEAVDERRRAQPKPRPSAPSGDEAFLDCMNQMLKVKSALLRLVENLNEGRKNGYLTPAVIREFVAEGRMLFDALEEIANSRGLTDEALAEWIGAE